MAVAVVLLGETAARWDKRDRTCALPADALKHREVITGANSQVPCDHVAIVRLWQNATKVRTTLFATVGLGSQGEGLRYCHGCRFGKPTFIIREQDLAVVILD